MKLPLAILLGSFAIAGAAPSVTLGTPTSKADGFDAKAVTAVVKKSSDKLVACYKQPHEGTITATITIGADGKVSAAAVHGLDDTSAKCMSAVLKKLVFAKAKAAFDVDVPLTYESGVTEGGFASLTGTGDISSGFDDSNIYGGLLGSDVGSGGGGTGWGTIGTGRYGVIGHGSGTSSGYGVGPNRKRGGMGIPSTSIGQPTTKGDLDKAIIRRYVKRNIQKITYCYEKALLGDKTGKLAGTVTVSFTIRDDGLVADSTGEGVSKDVADCVAAVIGNIEFPKPKGGPVVVRYPLTFRPDTSGSPPAK